MSTALAFKNFHITPLLLDISHIISNNIATGNIPHDTSHKMIALYLKHHKREDTHEGKRGSSK